MVNDEENRAFSSRLNELLDVRGFTAAGRGRQVELARRYGLVQQSVGKWLKGEGMPKTTQMIQIARDFQCNFEWLALGTGPRDRVETPASPYAELVRRLEGASPETRRLVEAALLSEHDPSDLPLSPSLMNLVRFLKQQIKEESPRDDGGETAA